GRDPGRADRLRDGGCGLPRPAHRGDAGASAHGGGDARPRAAGRGDGPPRRPAGLRRLGAVGPVRPRGGGLAEPDAREPGGGGPGAGPRRGGRQAVRAHGRGGARRHPAGPREGPAAHRLPEPALGRRLPHPAQADRGRRAGRGPAAGVALRTLAAGAQGRLARDRRRAGVAADDDTFIALTHAGGARSHLWVSAVAPSLGPRFRVLGSSGAYLKYGLDVQEERLRAGRSPASPGFGEEDEDRWGVTGAGDDLRTVPTEPGA